MGSEAVTSARRARLAVLPALAATSCSLVFGYPAGDERERAATCANGRDDDFDGDVDCDDRDCREVEPCRGSPEADPTACDNHVDDDRDGRVDCDDDDCRGHCPETEPRSCDNGVDDDGDGAVDRADLGCWQVLGDVPAVRACASIPPLDVAEPFPLSTATAAPGQTYAVRGAAWFPAWASAGRNDARLEVVAGTVALVSRFRVAPEPLLTARATLAVPDGARARILVVPAAAAEFTTFELTDAMFGVEIASAAGAAALARATPGVLRTATAPAGPWEVELAATEGAVTASLTPTAGAPVAIELARPAGLGAGAVVVELRRPPAPAESPFLDDLRVRAAGADPCGVHAAPLFTADATACESGLLHAQGDLGRAFAVAGAGADDTCAVFTDAATAPGSLALRSARSADGGLRFTPSGTLAALAAGETTSGVGLARDRGRWRAVVAVSGGDPSVPRALRYFASEDCTAWDATGEVDAAGAVSPSLVARHGEAPELYYLRAREAPAAYELVRAEDATAATASDPVLGRVSAELGLTLPVTLTRLGGELALVYPDPRGTGGAGLALATWDLQRESAPRRVELPLLRPDRDAGERTLRAGALLATGERLVLVYSASGRPLPFSWPESSGEGTFLWSAVVSAGTPPAATILPPFACGDGRCEPGAESCASCADDCCSVLAVAPAPEPWGSHYSPALARAVVFADSPLRWPLPSGLVGDFALDLGLELRASADPAAGRLTVHLRDAEDRGPRLVAAYRPTCGTWVYATTFDLDGDALERLATAPCDSTEHRLLLGPVARVRVERRSGAYHLALADAAGCATPGGELTVPIPTAELDVAPTELEIVSRDPELELLIDGVRIH